MAIPALVAWTALFTVRSNFFYDDFIYFEQARDSGLSLAYLFRELNVHFSPGYRLVDWAFQSLVPLSWPAAQIFLLTGFAACLVLVYLILAELFEPGVGAVVLVVVYGSALVNVDVIQWWSSGLQSVPSVSLSLVCILLYLRFYRTGARRLLALSAAAFVLATLFYVKAILVPGYLILIRVLLLDRSRPLREVVVDTLREWDRVWAAYLAPLGVYVVVYVFVYWSPSKAASVPALASFFAVSWVRAFVPSLVGLHVSGSQVSGWVEAGIVLSQLALVALVAWSVRHRRGAWRGWAFLAVGFVANVALVGIPRVGTWGPGIAYLLRYYPEPLFLVPIALGAVFLRSRVSDHALLVEAHGWWASVERRRSQGWRPLLARRPALAGRRAPVRNVSIEGSAPLQRRASLRRLALCGLAVAALGAHFALAGAGDGAIAQSSPGRQSGPYLRNVTASLRRIEAKGVEPSIVGGVVPNYVVASWSVYGPPLYNHYSQLFRLIDPKLRFDSLASPLYQVATSGRMHPVSFLPAVGGSVQALMSQSELSIRYAQVTPSPAGGVCVQASGVFPAWVQLAPSIPLGAGPWYVGLRYSASAAETVPLYVDRGAGYPYPYDRFASLGAGENRSVLSPVGAGKLARLRLDLPPGSRTCLSEMFVGRLAAGSPTSASASPAAGAAPASGAGATGAGAAGAGAPLVVGGALDSFAGPSDPASLGRLATGTPWRAVSGTWGSGGGQAYVSRPATAGPDIAVVGAATTGAGVQVRLAHVAPGAGLVFGYRDPANYWYVAAVPAYASWEVVKVVGGSPHPVANTWLSPVSDGTTVAVSTAGHSIEIALDGVVTQVVTDPGPLGSGAAGMIETGPASAAARFAGFRVAAGQASRGAP